MAKRKPPKLPYRPEDTWETKARQFDNRVEGWLSDLERYVLRRWPNLARRLGIGPR
ncbi:MAG TPA: hypothetical protein VF137_01385 [Candidatus Dormibacteraeota bacterium]